MKRIELREIFKSHQLRVELCILAMWFGGIVVKALDLRLTQNVAGSNLGRSAFR